MTTATDTRFAREGKYLAFELAREHYGVEILHVREITDAAGLVPVPNQPACFCGVIGLRGRTVPVVSMRRRLGLGREECGDPQACVVVVDVDAPEGRLVVGLLVDRVAEVRFITADEIGPAPGLGGGLEEGDWIAGIARVEPRGLCLVDVDRLLTRDERDRIAAAHGNIATN
jgi:purine-binding chemotaxis protein CheW